MLDFCRLPQKPDGFEPRGLEVTDDPYGSSVTVHDFRWNE